jgi:hypothetical protein
VSEPSRDTTLIARARRKLARWPDVAYDASPAALRIPAPNPGGFDIHLQERRRAYVVRFDGWTRTFDRDDDALDCLELGLSDSCRLAVTCRGTAPVAWTLEIREFGMWVPHRRTCRRIVPFWRPERTEYKQNVIITEGS